MSDFDFDAGKSPAYYQRPRKTGPHWAVVGVVASVLLFLIVAAVVALAVWRQASGPSPTIEGNVWTAGQLMDFLQDRRVNPSQSVTVIDDDHAAAGLLIVWRFPDAAAARVAAANHRLAAFAWGRFVIAAPPDIHDRAYAALHP